MKEYKSKFTKMMFETLLGLCASWFVYNLAGKLTHSFLFAVIGAAAVLAFFLIKVFYTDFISIILTEDKKMVVKRCNKVINIFDIEQYYWSEYPKDCKTKNEDDQDIYYVCKETGKENYIDASNLKGEDYEQLLEDLGERIENKQVINVETIKK